MAGTLLIANVWGVLDAKIAASGAAREAARAYVESTSGSVDGAFAEAAAAAAAAIAGHGRDPSRMTITPESPLRFERCAPATFVVRYRVPVLELPWVDGLGGRSFSVTARHRELVDPFRNDVPLGAGLGAPC